MNEPELPASIQITRTNLSLLEQVGVVMQKQFPHLWGDQKPTPSSIVGFLANEFLTDGANSPRALTPSGETLRAAGGSVSRDGDNPASSSSEDRQVYALRGADGKLRGTWHSLSYEECPGRAAFQVQHPDDDYSLVGFDEVMRRRLKQCAFCSRYDRGEL